MKTIAQNKIQAHLSKLLDQVAKGQSVIVTRNNQPIATLNPPASPSVLNLKPISVGKIYNKPASDDDLPGEMLNI